LPWSSISLFTTGAVGMLRRVCKASQWDVRLAASILTPASSADPVPSSRFFARAMPALGLCTAALALAVIAALIDPRAAVAGLVGNDPEPAQTPTPASEDSRADEERMLADARQCMVTADPCVVLACYAKYMEKYGKTGVFLGIAKADLERAEKACRPPPPPPPPPPSIAADGVYNAKSNQACGAKSQFGIHIDIRKGTVSWEHDFRGISYKWEGVMDRTGAIRASVGNSKEFVADGRYIEAGGSEIVMHYPQCSGSTISLSILGILRRD
jgi:hypothetical protein